MTMFTRITLFSVLVAGLVLAGCETEPPAEPTPPEAAPSEKIPEEPPEKAPARTVDEAALAEAVGHTPADACGVVVVSNVGEFEKGLKSLLGEAADEMDLVGELAADLPPDAFDATGSLVMILPPNLDEAEPVLLLHIKDASAIRGADAGAGIVGVTHTQPGAPSEHVTYVLPLKSWALVADQAEAIKAVMRAEKKVQLSDEQKAALAGHMVWVHLNPPSLAAMADRSMKKMRDQVADQNPQAARNVETSLKMLDWLLGVATDVTRIDLVGDVTPEGIHILADGQLAEGSNLAALAGAGVPIDDYKAGLPTTDSLVLAAWAGMDWQKAVPPMKALIRPMLDIVAEGEDENTRKAINDMWESYEKWSAVMGNHVALVLELPEPGTGMYQLAEVYGIKDPKAYRDLLTEYLDASGAFMDAIMSKFTMGAGMPGVPPQMPHVKSDVDFKEAAETIDGVPVDIMRIRFTVDLPPDAPPQAGEQIKTMLDTMYGPNGMEFRMAVLDDKGLATMGGKDVMARAIKAARGEAPDLSTAPKVAEALAKVPEGQGVLLLSAANYMYMAMGMVDRMMSQNIPPEVLAEAEKAGHGPIAHPPATDLIRVTGPSEGTGVTVTIDVPASDLRAAVETAKKGGERMGFLMQKQQERMQEQQQSPSAPKAAPAPAK